MVEPLAAQVSSDAGLLPFRQLDEQLGLTRQFAEALTDRRHVGYIGHSFLEMTRARIITCAENDLVVCVCLLHGTAHPALGAQDDLAYLVGRLRKAWPDVQIHLRGDAGFGTPTVYEASEELQVDSTVGLGMNVRLQKLTEAVLAQAVAQQEAAGQPQRLFTAFEYRADSWSKGRWVVVKCEANAQGTNRRAVVTNRPGARILPGAAYDGYADRGESENRNKELKCGLHADRLSDHRYFAKLFRLYLHAAAYNLLVRLRRSVADLPPPAPSQDVPAEALAGCQRRRQHNQRRECDPLGEGQPCTWRTRLIKVAARVRQTSRRVVVELFANWPYLKHFLQVSQRLLQLRSASCDSS